MYPKKGSELAKRPFWREGLQQKYQAGLSYKGNMVFAIKSLE